MNDKVDLCCGSLADGSAFWYVDRERKHAVDQTSVDLSRVVRISEVKFVA